MQYDTTSCKPPVVLALVDNSEPAGSARLKARRAEHMFPCHIPLVTHVCADNSTETFCRAFYKQCHSQ